MLTVVRGLRLEGHLTGASLAPAVEIDGKDAADKDAKVPNSMHESLILGSLARDVLA